MSATSSSSAELFSPSKFWIVGLVLITGLFLIYSPSLEFQFILDDLTFLNDPRVRTGGHMLDYFGNYVWSQFTGGPSSFYRPLFVLWLRINFIFNEMSSWGWHFFSIAKHVLAAISLAVVVWKLLRDRIAGLVAATLFAFHPLHTEVVAWVTVPDALTATAAFACVFFYLKYNALVFVKPKSDRRNLRKAKVPKIESPSQWWLIISAACYLAALFTKESAIVLPFIIFALAIQLAPIAGQDGNADGSDFTSRLLFAFRQSLFFIGGTAIYFLMRRHAFHGHLGAFTTHLTTWKTVAFSVPKLLWFYVRALLWPFQSHAFGDSIPVQTFTIRDVLWPALGVCCALALLITLLLWAFKKTRTFTSDLQARRVQCALLLGTLFLVLPILPAFNLNALNPGDFMHGRYAYLSCAGLMILVGSGWHLAGRSRTVLLLPIALITISFAALTYSQETAWKDNLSVFTSGNQIAPLNHQVAMNLTRARVELALPLVDEGRCAEAIPVFDEATKQFPNDWVGWAALGNCFDQLNDLPKAEQYLHRAADLANQPRVAEEWQDVVRRLQQQNPVH